MTFGEAAPYLVLVAIIVAAWRIAGPWDLSERSRKGDANGDGGVWGGDDGGGDGGGD